MRRPKSREDVELNLAAMLDMAFQILTFFILTFKPVPVEGEISLKFPPPAPVLQPKEQKTTAAAAGDTFAFQDSIAITLEAQANGGLSLIKLNGRPIPTLKQLDDDLRAVVSNADVQFEQVVVQVAPELKYQELMRVVDVCARQRMPDGTPLTKLSVTRIP